MPFLPEETKVAVGVGNIVVILKDAVEITGDDPQDAYQSAHFQLVIERNDGSTVTRKGNLAPKITPVQRAALMAVMDAIRVQAEDEILPA